MNGDLPELLALLHTSRRRWRTLRAEGEEWRDEERTNELFHRLRSPTGVFTARGTPGPADRDPRWRVWIRQPQRARVEFGGAHGSRFVQIAEGSRRWMSLPDGRVVADERPGGPLPLGPVSGLVQGEDLLAILDFEIVGPGHIAGRQTLSVRGTPRAGEGPALRGPGHPLVRLADEVMLDVDVDRGVILRLEALSDGTPFFRLQATEVAYDEELPDVLFTVPPGSVESARMPRSHHPGPPEDVLGAAASIDTVVARSPSVVVALVRAVAYPEGFELYVTVRTRDARRHGTVESGRPRSWAGAAAFPGESLVFGVAFSDGRTASTGNFGDRPPPEGVTLAPLSGSGTSARFDQRFWVRPLPPPGRLGLIVAWPLRGLSETRADVSGEAILEAASRAVPLWV